MNKSVKNAVFAFFFIFSGLISCNAQVNNMPIEKLEISKDESKQIVDVRTPEEYKEGHLPGAININLFDEDFSSRFADYDKAQTIYVYCRSGKRSAKASGILESLGFKDVVNLEGGFLAWEEAEKPVEH